MNVLGIDCGGHTAPTVLNVSADRPRYVHTETIRVGREEPRKKPKTVTPSDGRAPYTLTHRTVICDADIDAALPRIERVITQHSVRRVIFERVEHVYLPVDPSAAASIATHIHYASEVRRAARDLAVRLGCEVECVTAGGWRWVACGLITGTRGKKRAKAFLGEKIPTMIDGWPEVSDDHQRDGAGLVLWDVEMGRRRRGESETVNRVTAELKARMTPWATTEREARAARERPRAAPIPCGRCGGPERHAREVCPVVVAAREAKERRAELARERGEAARAGMFVRT